MKYFILSLIVFTFCFGQSEEYKSFAKEIKQSIERAHYNGAVSTYNELISKSERLIQFDKSVWYGHYYRAFLLNDLGNRFLNSDEDKASEYFEEAITSLETCKTLSGSARIDILFSDILGKKIKISPMKAMFLGPKSGNYIENAYEKSPKDPMVLIAYAISKMHTPSMFGGDKTLARRLLNDAIKLNDSFQSADVLLIDCRKADAYLWLAQLDRMEEKQEQAVKNIKNALGIEPDYMYAKLLLKSYKK